MTNNDLLKYFPEGYWEKWSDVFGHDFISAHIDRTIQYNDRFGDRIAGRKILEVGGYPGLLISMYLERGCDVVAIDSPKYRPQYYLDWCSSKFVYSIEHDINSGPPPLNDEEHYDFAIMSDVLLHNEGFPSEFLGWVISHCSNVILLNYPGEGDIKSPSNHTLEAGFPIPQDEKISSKMLELGGELILKDEVGGRVLLEYTKKRNEQNEISGSDPSLRDESVS